MPTYDGIGTSITHRVEVAGDSLFQDVDGGTLSTKVPVQIFSNYYASPGSVDSSRQLRFRVQPDGESNVSNSYVTDMGVKGADGSNYFFITAPQNTSNVGDQNTFVISTTGNVGINTTNPIDDLHVRGGITFQYGNSINATTDSQSWTNNKVLSASWNGSQDITQLWVPGGSSASTPRITILSNGNVGIGTDSPVDNFAVFKNTLLSSNVEDSTYAVFGNQYSSGDVLNVVSFGDVRICCDANNASTGKKISFITNGGTNYDSGTVGGGSELMTILDTGNVGIGTDSPLRKLDVRSGDAVVATNWISGAFGPELSAGDRVVIGNLYGKACIGAHNSGLTGWADLTINSAGGNVGIGTTNPWAGLHQYRSVALSYVINLCGGAAFNSWNTGIINLNTTNRVILMIAFTPSSGQYLSAIVTMSQAYPPTPAWTIFRNTGSASLVQMYNNGGQPYLGFRNGSTTQTAYLTAIVLH